MKLIFNKYENLPENVILAGTKGKNQTIAKQDIEGGKPVEITSPPKYLKEMNFANVEGHIYVDPVIADAQVQKVNTAEVSKTKEELAGKTFKDDHGTTYAFDSEVAICTMTTITEINKTHAFGFDFKLYPGYCVLVPKKDNVYPRQDALYYGYKKTLENGFTLTMIKPSLPNPYAPAVINLKNNAPGAASEETKKASTKKPAKEEAPAQTPTDGQ